MTLTCCVPECKSGYASEGTSVGASVSASTSASSASTGASANSGTNKISFHRFPKNDDLRRQWIRNIPRDN